jgi:hypothetical protein
LGCDIVWQTGSVTFLCDCQQGSGLETALIDHLQIVTANYYNTVTNFHTFQITTAHAKSFQSAFTNRFPVMDLPLHWPTLLFMDSLTTDYWQLSVDNWPTSKVVLVVTSQHRPCRKHHSLLYCFVSMWTCLYAKAISSNVCIYLLIKNLLPSSECCFIVWFQVVTQ